jgi:hypothetical protein
MRSQLITRGIGAILMIIAVLGAIPEAVTLAFMIGRRVAHGPDPELTTSTFLVVHGMAISGVWMYVVPALLIGAWTGLFLFGWTIFALRRGPSPE